jgi:serine/threonine-protein kinase RsbW
MPTVEVTFSALPAHVRTARLIATAVARRAGVAEELLDEVRLAVGEACSRAVAIHQRKAPDTSIGMSLSDEQDRFTVSVTDVGPADEDSTLASADLDDLDTDALAAPSDSSNPMPDLLPPGFGLAVISGLVEDVEVLHDLDGTHVRMTWPAHDVMAPHADDLG